ncbi:FecR family protein [Sphingobacterium corticis]|uniref:FecR family protein n=1 Tax=Sphingobacterium corticis TaxID=1812823 RepID=A0ABW5NKF3_9SPHI
MNRKYVKDLLKRYEEGNCSRQELDLIDLWLFRRGASDEIQLSDDEENELAARALIGLEDRLQIQLAVPAKRIPIWHKIQHLKTYVLPISAVFMVALFIWLWQTKDSHTPSEKRMANTESVAQSIATIPTSYSISVSEKEYLIDEIPLNTKFQIGDATILKLAQNRIHYMYSSNPNTEAQHTISVPSGKDLHVSLPDGSKVWMNTESTISFAESFTQQERHVALSGEAFFEVASDKAHPFLVQNADFSVKATGTQFNVRAYPNEELKTTTLVEGKVAVKDKRSAIELIPNQQWSALSSNKPIVETVDVSSVLGNRDGYFTFHQKNIREIMSEVARWYAIDVHFKGNITKEAFGGTFSRKRDVDELLDYLSVLGGFQIERQGRRVTIMP